MLGGDVLHIIHVGLYLQVSFHKWNSKFDTAWGWENREGEEAHNCTHTLLEPAIDWDMGRRLLCYVITKLGQGCLCFKVGALEAGTRSPSLIFTHWGRCNVSAITLTETYMHLSSLSGHLNWEYTPIATSLRKLSWHSFLCKLRKLSWHSFLCKVLTRRDPSYECYCMFSLKLYEVMPAW